MNPKLTNKAIPAIRPMEERDVDAIVALESSIFSDPWPAETFRDGLDDSDHRFLVAEINGQIVGYAAYYVELGEGRLTNIAVIPEYRRKSIAKKILEHILDLVKKDKCKYIFLDVRPTNKAAIDLYVKYGFYEVYRRPRYYRVPAEDALVMVKNLAEE